MSTTEPTAPIASPEWTAIADACDPNKTKSLLIGEFTTGVSEWLGSDEASVDWTAIKQIQAAIFEQAKINAGWYCEGCGSKQHILQIRDQGHKGCCAKRRLVPPAEGKQP